MRALPALRRAMCAILAAVASAGLPAAAEAQVRPDPLARPLAAYRDLEFDAAANGLRALLERTSPAALSADDRARALMYLGATEVFRQRREAATEAFRTLLLANPRYRPDQLIFPPDILTAFAEARSGVRVVSVLVPPVTEIRALEDQLAVRLHVAGAHEVRAVILDPAGSPVRVLFDGLLGDSVTVPWNGRDGLGRLREAGDYRLRVISRAPTGREERAVEIPLVIIRLTEDTLAVPGPLDPAGLRPEMAAPTAGTRFLVAGLGTALVAAALPAIAGGGSDGGGLRFGIAAAIGGAGVLGFQRARTPSPIPANIEANRRAREAREREVERVRAENAARRSSGRMRIEAGVPAVVELP